MAATAPSRVKRGVRGARWRGAVLTGLAVAALAAASCSSSGDESSSSVTGAAPSSTATTLGGLGPAVRVQSNDPDSVKRLFEAWTIDQDGDGYTGACPADRTAVAAAQTWCSVALGPVSADGDTYLMAHPGSAEAEVALLVGPSNGFYVIADEFTVGAGDPPAWVGSAG